MEAGASDDPDAELLARIGDGDETAFRALIARKLPRVHALSLRLLGDRSEADDVAQDAFLRAWRQARHWRQGEARFDTWLHRVVLNLCHDRRRRRREVLLPELPEQVDPAPPADRTPAIAWSRSSPRSALALLPPRQREAMILHTYQELPNTETAAIMGISVEALESLLARARRGLRSMLEGAP